jgi:hypothetical protein
MTGARGVATALKEWAVCEAALASGRTIVLLRKGGIREPARAFRIERAAFALYPTYEHQRADLLAPDFAALLPATLADAPPPGTVRVRLWLEVTDAYELTDAEHLAALAPFHMWTAAYAEERLRWRPKQPLLVMLVRAYHLAAPLVLPYEARYGGCTSWVELAVPPDQTGRVPVLDAAAYAALAAPVRAALAGLPAATIDAGLHAAR